MPSNLQGKAKTATEFANSVQVLGQGGDGLAGAANEIDKLVAKGSGFSGDISAACEISEAVSVLNDWALPNTRVSPQDAAKAFDRLFGGAARYMSKLPFPANTYAQLFSAIREYSFFSNMQKMLDPLNLNNSEVRQLLELDRQ